MHAFMLYINDWLSSKNIEMMDAAEERGYLRLLLREAQEHDCGLPDDDAVLAHLSLLGPQWFKVTADKSKRFGAMTSGQKIRMCFIAREGHTGRIFNERLLKEWERHQTICDRNRGNAKFGNLGGRPKKTHLGYSGEPKETQDGNSGNSKITPPSPSPQTSNTKKELTSVSSKETAAPTAAKATRFDDRPLTEEWAQWPMSKHGWSREQTEIAYGAFSNYFANGKGKGQTAKNWLRSWQTWCGNERVSPPRQQALVPYESNTDRAIKRAYELHEQGLL